MAILAVLGGIFTLPKPVIQWQMGACSYVRSSELPSRVAGCVDPRGMAPAAPSRDLELVKPGPRFVEEQPRMRILFHPEILVKYALPVQYTVFTRPVQVFPVQNIS